ncbi:MAG: hypothetical protein AB7G06_05610 [Bdellovibrionales bacterium]
MSVFSEAFERDLQGWNGPISVAALDVQKKQIEYLKAQGKQSPRDAWRTDVANAFDHKKGPSDRDWARRQLDSAIHAYAHTRYNTQPDITFTSFNLRAYGTFLDTARAELLDTGRSQVKAKAALEAMRPAPVNAEAREWALLALRKI